MCSINDLKGGKHLVYMYSHISLQLSNVIYNYNENTICRLFLKYFPPSPTDPVTRSSSGTSSSPSDDLNISRDIFNSAVTSNNYPRPQDAQYTAFIAGIPKSGITTKRELAMLLAQILHESGGLTALSELACANNGCPGSYDWLNGHQFFGRGYVQLTWSYNYRAASLDLYGDANVLLNDPESVATDQNKAWNVSFWYWKANVHNAPGVQDGQFGSSTKAINGNLECSAPGNPAALARYAIYQRIFTIFGISGSPNPAGCA